MRRKVKDDNRRRRLKRVMSIRKRVEGTPECPRLAVFRSAKHIYAQLIDDLSGKTLVFASSVGKDTRDGVKGLKKADAAEKVGSKLAEIAGQKGISTVVFDRHGWSFHGRVAALAKGAREGGLKF